MAPNKYKSIKHFKDLSSDELEAFYIDCKNKTVEWSEKIDGFGLRIGKTLDGTPFIETSRPGLS